MFGIEVDPNDILEGLKSAKDFEGKEDGEVTWSYQRQVFGPFRHICMLDRSFIVEYLCGVYTFVDFCMLRIESRVKLTCTPSLLCMGRHLNVLDGQVKLTNCPCAVLEIPLLLSWAFAPQACEPTQSAIPCTLQQKDSLELFNMDILICDNVDAIFAKYRPGTFLPALCNLFMDTNAPLDVSRPLTLWWNVKHSSSLVTLAVAGKAWFIPIC
jgi:hypothetical protein